MWSIRTALGLLCLKLTIFLFFTNNLNSAVYTFSSNGKTYQIVDTKKSWADASQYAVENGGYLAIIESQAEQSAIYSAISTNVAKTYTAINDGGGIAYVWIGANDNTQEGTWIWDGTNSGTGVNFWNGQGDNGLGNGQVVSGRYNNWGGNQQYGSPAEPDDFNSAQDAAAIALEPWPKDWGFLGTGGEWNDISSSNQLYFVVEYDFSSAPGKANKPTGTTSLCQDAPNTEYSTVGIDQAGSYIWTISPSNAGTVAGNGTTISINWDAFFTGAAQISVSAKNPLGTGTTSDILFVTVRDRVGKTDAPKGLANICNLGGTNEYTINGLTGVDNYSWTISPKEAGTITGTTKTATVQWIGGFVGEAIITAAGVNDCGTGVNSDNFTVKLNAVPVLNSKPFGTEKIDLNSSNTEYSLIAPNNATYTWKISPENAGVIIPDTISKDLIKMSVNWNENFKGEAEISVNAKNDCGESPYSEPLKVLVSDKPGKAQKPTGIETICQGTTETEFKTLGVGENLSYVWMVSPKEAGEISGSGKTAILKWNIEYSGKAEISVAAKGMYGNGAESDKFVVSLTAKPEKCNIPTGSNTLCINASDSDYMTTAINNTDSYNWKIDPKEAGIITGNGKSVKVNWADSFIGQAKISVTGVNNCGEGIYSETLIIQIGDKPAIPSTPLGAQKVVKKQKNVTYTINAVENASNYKWKLSPSEAGTIESDKTNATINWADNFIGNAQISANAINDCGETEFSSTLNITVADTTTSVDDFIDEQIDLFPNPVDAYMNIKYNSNNSKIKVIIYNETGLICKTISDIQINQAGVFIIKTDDLAPGKYTCIFIDGTKKINKNFVVIR